MHALIDFEVKGDESGSLVSIENDSQIPFDIKRVFYIYNTASNVLRGNHANRKSQFVMIVLCGSCKVRIKENEQDTVIVLDNPHTGLWLDKMVWKEMYDFSADAMLLVLSNEVYDKNEYIHDYKEFLQEAKK